MVINIRKIPLVESELLISSLNRRLDNQNHWNVALLCKFCIYVITRTNTRIFGLLGFNYSEFGNSTRIRILQTLVFTHTCPYFTYKKNLSETNIQHQSPLHCFKKLTVLHPGLLRNPSWISGAIKYLAKSTH